MYLQLLNSSRRLVPYVLTLAILSVTVGGCVVSKNPITGNKRAYGYSWEQEVQIGQQADQQIISQYGLYDDQGMTSYVDRIGQDLLDVSHLRRAGTDEKFASTPFTFRVLDSPVVNAFALPGGFVYVTRGLMAHLENEAQLAVVLGHEIGHVAARHASQRALSQQARQLGLIAGAIGGQALFGSDVARGILDLGSLANQFITLSYSREDERESDDLGVEYASMAGYAAAEGAEFFRSLERLGEQAGQEIPSWQSSHPDPGERYETIQEEAADWRQRLASAADRIERDTYFARIDGMIYGENPRQGFTRDNTFYHPDLEFRFPVPPSFRVLNQPTQVAMIPENQQAFMVFQIDSEHGSAREAASALAAQEGITVVQSGVGQAHGLPARYVLFDATTQDGQQLRVRAHFVDYAGNVYQFMGVTTRELYSSYESRFLTTMQGFQPLDDPAILAIQPDRLQTRRADRSAAFSTLIEGSLPEGVSAESLAIVNQLFLSTTVDAGRMYKTVN